MRCKSGSLLLAVLATAAVALGAGCGGGGAGAERSGGSPDGSASGAAADGSRPAIVVTTSILGDVVANLVGDQASVEVIMPPGTSPHEFQPSARQAAAMRSADALVMNGAGFEEGLIDATGAARDDGVAAYEAIDAVGRCPGCSEEAARDGPGRPPTRTTSRASRNGAAALARGGRPALLHRPAADGGRRPGHRRVPGAAGAGAGRTTAVGPYGRPPTATWPSSSASTPRSSPTLDRVPAERRKLVTNHEVFGYFADRYGFEVLGVVVPGGGTQAAPSPAELDGLAGLIRREQIRAVFADTSSPEQLAAALAAEVGDVEVVELYSESLGPAGSPGGTYLDMVRTNAGRIAAALAG